MENFFEMGRREKKDDLLNSKGADVPLITHTYPKNLRIKNKQGFVFSMCECAAVMFTFLKLISSIPRRSRF
jgi:hypothetical protein